MSRDALFKFLTNKPVYHCDEDAVKLVQVFFVECILRSKRHARLIDEDIMKFVEDQHKFNEFPWGRQSYLDTIGYLHKALKNKNPGSSDSVTYELCGFPLVFQIWSYETIPKLGEKYANKLGDEIPKILNWSNSKRANLDSLHSDIFGNQNVSNI